MTNRPQRQPQPHCDCTAGFPDPVYVIVYRATARPRQNTQYRDSLLGWTQEEIGKIVGVARETISDWVGSFRKLAEYTNSPESRQEKIGAVVGLTHQAVSLRMQEISNLIKLAKPELEKANTPVLEYLKSTQNSFFHQHIFFIRVVL